MMARQMWDDNDKDEQNDFELMATCPMGVTCVGGLFSFLIGWSVQILSSSERWHNLRYGSCWCFWDISRTSRE